MNARDIFLEKWLEMQRQGGDEISEVGPKTEDEYHLHPKPKLKITEDKRPKTSYTILYIEATYQNLFSVGP